MMGHISMYVIVIPLLADLAPQLLAQQRKAGVVTLIALLLVVGWACNTIWVLIQTRPFHYLRLTIGGAAVVFMFAIARSIDVGRLPTVGEAIFGAALWLVSTMTTFLVLRRLSNLYETNQRRQR